MAGATAGGAGTAGPLGGGGTGVIPMAGTTGSAAGNGGGAGTGAAAGNSSEGGAGGVSPNNGGAGTVGTAGAGGASSGSAGTSVAGTSGSAGTGAAGTGAAGTGAAGTGAAGTGAAGTGAAGTGALGQLGCADGTREGYLDRAKYPKIAACVGGWEEPGLVSPDTKVPQCDRRAGNDGDRTDGHGCSVADLCASGWHVCESAKVVATLASSCADAVAPSSGADVFFVTRQRATNLCEDGPLAGTNNLFGCGTTTIGVAADKSCAPLTRMLRDVECSANFPWACSEGPSGTSQNEQGVVNKRGSNRGGVLCCKD